MFIAFSLPVPEQLPAPLKKYASCYERWLEQQINQISKGDDDADILEALLMGAQRKALLADWLRELVATGLLKPSERVPLYMALGETFALSIDQVASVVHHLRRERVLPRRRPRQDSGVPQWQKRDDSCLLWIGEQRAVRYDQLQRLLARESEADLGDRRHLSMTRTTQIINRWSRAHLVAYRKIYVNQPGWIWLTSKGLDFADLPFRPGAPAESRLDHYYYINEVRLQLEQKYGVEHLTWTSERDIQHWQEQMRKRGRTLTHTPDALVEVGEQTIDIEVELTRKSQREVEQVICGDWGASMSNNALCYYVSRQAFATVTAAWHAVQKSNGARGIRPWVEVVELDKLFQRPEQRRE